MPITTKEDLLAEMARLRACDAATTWVSAQNGTADEIWLACTDVSWLIWFAGRLNPDAIAGFAKRCSARATDARATAAAAARVAAAYAAAYAAYAATDAADAAATDAAYAAADAATDAAYAAYAAADAADAADAERALQLSDLHQMLPSRTYWDFEDHSK